MLNPKRLQSIFQKHVNALALELAHELASPMADRLGISLTDYQPDNVTPPPATPAEPFTNAALIYDARAKKWSCPKCRAFSDLRRRAVTTHMRFCTGTALAVPEPAKVRKKSKKKPT